MMENNYIGKSNYVALRLAFLLKVWLVVTLLFILSVHAQSGRAYSLDDVKYVTSSENPNVIGYVMCLQREVSRQQQGTSILDGMADATQKCEHMAIEIYGTRDEPDALAIRQSILECGFRPGDASPDADCGDGPLSDSVTGNGANGVHLRPRQNNGNHKTVIKRPPHVAAFQADRVQLTPTIIETGKWLEGIAFDGRWLWAAESGQRTIAKIDFDSGRIVSRVKVGRLPVDLVSDGDGVSYTMVNTDQLIWRQDARGRGKKFAKVSECPEGMILNGQELFVLTMPDCSSVSSRVIRYSVSNGRSSKSGVMGEWATDLAAFRNKVWVSHSRGDMMSIVDGGSMGIETMHVAGADLWSVAADSRHIYSGGRATGTMDDGLVVMIDPVRRAELHRVRLSERVANIASDEEFVIAVGDKGTIWILSATDLKVLRTITLSTGGFNSRGLQMKEDLILISNQQYRGENGAVYVIGNWKPNYTPGNVPQSPRGPVSEYSADQLVGQYRVDPGGNAHVVKASQLNDWHTGKIVMNGSQLRWVNNAGTSWALEFDPGQHEIIRTGTDNPYYAKYPHMREMKVVWKHGRVVGFVFDRLLYGRK